MQGKGMDKLAHNTRATLTGLSALAINHARKVLGRSFEGGDDWDFVNVAKAYSSNKDEGSRSFTK